MLSTNIAAASYIRRSKSFKKLLLIFFGRSDVEWHRVHTQYADVWLSYDLVLWLRHGLKTSTRSVYFSIVIARVHFYLKIESNCFFIITSSSVRYPLDMSASLHWTLSDQANRCKPSAWVPQSNALIYVRSAHHKVVKKQSPSGPLYHSIHYLSSKLDYTDVLQINASSTHQYLANNFLWFTDRLTGQPSWPQNGQCVHRLH